MKKVWKLRGWHGENYKSIPGFLMQKDRALNVVTIVFNSILSPLSILSTSPPLSKWVDKLFNAWTWMHSWGVPIFWLTFNCWCSFLVALKNMPLIYSFIMMVGELLLLLYTPTASIPLLPPHKHFNITSQLSGDIACLLAEWHH